MSSSPPSDLVRLATEHGTDKWGRHWYASKYETHFAPRRLEPLTLLEIGVGGYEDPARGGESLRMWKDYFPSARIFGIDHHDKTAMEQDRIRIFQGSQDDRAFLERVVAAAGPLDIVIDDGSHHNAHVAATFEVLFPHLREGGIYVVEDTQTSYWPSYGGSLDVDAPHTTMNFFKRIADGLNHAEFIRPGYQPGFLDLNVASVHFYHGLVFVYRGRNDEESNILRENVPPPWLVGQ
jgi:Methyltransferase domain